MKQVVFLIVLLTFGNEVFSQYAIPQTVRAQSTLARLSDPNRLLSSSDMLYSIPLAPGKTVGDIYLNKKWNVATILLYQTETMLEGYPVKYDLKNNLLEIKTPQGIKILENKRIRNLVWIDSLTTEPHYFVNGSEYRIDGTPTLGLLEVVVDGEVPLLKRAELVIKKPDYVPALDVGSRDTELFIQEHYFFARGNEMVKIKGKNDVLKAAGSQASEVESYIKINKLNTNKAAGLKSAFEFINKSKS